MENKKRKVCFFKIQKQGRKLVLALAGRLLLVLAGRLLLVLASRHLLVLAST